MKAKLSRKELDDLFSEVLRKKKKKKRRRGRGEVNVGTYFHFITFIYVYTCIERFNFICIIVVVDRENWLA